MNPPKGWLGTIMARAEVTSDGENVVHLNRPTTDALFAAVKAEQSEMRAIVKEGRDLEQRHDECQTRLNNARAALLERMAEVGITGTAAGE